MQTTDRAALMEGMRDLTKDFIKACIGLGFDPVTIGCSMITAGTLTIKVATDEATATETIGHFHQRLLLSAIEFSGEAH